MPSFVQACIGWYQSFETSLFTVYLRLHTIAPLSSPLSSKTVLSATSEMCPGSRLFEACQTPFAVRVGARNGVKTATFDLDLELSAASL